MKTFALSFHKVTNMYSEGRGDQLCLTRRPFKARFMTLKQSSDARHAVVVFLLFFVVVVVFLACGYFPA